MKSSIPNIVLLWLRSPELSRLMLGLGALLLAIEGTWSVPIHTSSVFGVYIVLLLILLGLQLPRLRFGAAWLSHAGMLLVLAGSVLGISDRIPCKMRLYANDACSIAYTEDMCTVQLPFTVALDRFETEYYVNDSVAPKQFRSYLRIDGKEMVTEVNSPARYMGYSIYQDGYDITNGQYSVLKFVRDPWLPIVYAGMILLAMSALLLMLGRWNWRIILPIVTLIAVLFTLFSIARINFQTLVPVLRSWWFVPHLGMYMIAYSVVAVASIATFFNTTLAKQLMRSASGLIVLGMLMGSVWANQAWGDYWGWDPKENWAAVTWLLTVMCLHVRDARRWKITVYVLLTFVALQLTWYGVNYLPSAVNSLHIYNS